MRLFSNRSQRTSKCGKNKKVAHEARPSVSLMFLPHFDVLCDLLGSFSIDDGNDNDNDNDNDNATNKEFDWSSEEK